MTVSFGGVVTRWPKALAVPVAYAGISIQVGYYTHPIAAVIMIAFGLPIGGLLIVRQLRATLDELPARHLELSGKRPNTPILVATFSQLSPQLLKSSEQQRRLSRAAIPAALIAFCYLSVLPWNGQFLALTMMAVPVIALARIAGFHTLQRCHLSLAARWATKQYLLPKFDRLWLPSIAMATVAGLLAGTAAVGILPFRFAGTFVVLIPLVIAMKAGPDLNEWTLATPGAYPAFSMRAGSRKLAEK